jgi:hypothetical protein
LSPSFSPILLFLTLLVPLATPCYNVDTFRSGVRHSPVKFRIPTCNLSRCAQKWTVHRVGREEEFATELENTVDGPGLKCRQWIFCFTARGRHHQQGGIVRSWAYGVQTGVCPQRSDPKIFSVTGAKSSSQSP